MMMISHDVYDIPELIWTQCVNYEKLAGIVELLVTNNYYVLYKYEKKVWNCIWCTDATDLQEKKTSIFIYLFLNTNI